MSHPVLWPKKTFFYPIGNTVPVCLTRDLSPEQPANILLLGCGDPRNILYTMFSGIKPSSGSRALDITCCDVEPAVLARNALLFSLIVDNHDVDRIWNIFYHFKLDERSLSLLTQQCEKLVAISSDLDSWSTSPYSHFLRVCTRHTLAELHRHWQLYVRAQDLSTEKKRSLSAAFTRQYDARFEANKDSVTINLSPARSAGPFWAHASDVLSSHYKHYWQTGTVRTELTDANSPTLINPTFIYSMTGEGCAVHYGTYPLQCFHLASAYSGVGKSQLRENVKIGDLINCAKSQFRLWCSAFRTAVRPSSPEKLTVRLFTGDALALSRTLYHYQRTSSISCSLFVSGWGGRMLVLDGQDYDPKGANPAPAEFNVIDTSNVADHVGLLNILIATIPLLVPTVSSTLYTETLLVKDDGAVRSINEHLCADVESIALPLGISPVSYVSNFISYSNVHELMKHHVIKTPQYHERITWKVPYSGDSVVTREGAGLSIQASFQPLELATLLFDIYYRMFVDEDMSEKLRNGTLADSIVHYSRGTLAALLGLVKSKVDTDWTSTMKHFYHMLHADRKLLLGSNYYQELCCQLYMRGTYCVEALNPTPGLLDHIEWSKSRFNGWSHVPPVACLLFVVPREKLKVLEDLRSDEIGSPMLRCELKSLRQSLHNMFSSIQCVFGQVSIEGTGMETRAILDEDSAGWDGSSPLVVSVWVPSFNLAMDPSGTQVSLSLHSSGVAGLSLGQNFGLGLDVFTIKLSDADRVHILAERPHCSMELRSCRAAAPPSYPPSMQIAVGIVSGKVTTLCARWEKVNISPNDEVKSEQISPCVMKVSSGIAWKHLLYPFPIDGARSKLRIARKSGWIEVIVPLSALSMPGGFAVENFPVLLSESKPPELWNVHRVSLEHSPILHVGPEDPHWINPHVALALSDREHRLRDAHNAGTPVDVLVQVKDTIHCLFVRMSEPKATKIFGLTAPSCGVYTLIFFNQIRLDLAASTLVADVLLLPLTRPLPKKLGEHIASLSDSDQVMQVRTSGEEAVEWKKLLPVFVERCRTWSHLPLCEYIREGRVPLSIKLDQNPLCACGEGKSLDAFAGVQKWKKLAPYVTRAAISPLFAVSYVEDVGGALKGLTERLSVGLSAVVPKPACAQCGAPGGESKLSKCSRCRKVSYCGQSCQNVHWKQHKKECKAE